MARAASQCAHDSFDQSQGISCEHGCAYQSTRPPGVNEWLRPCPCLAAGLSHCVLPSKSSDMPGIGPGNAAVPLTHAQCTRAQAARQPFPLRVSRLQHIPDVTLRVATPPTPCRNSAVVSEICRRGQPTRPAGPLAAPHWGSHLAKQCWAVRRWPGPRRAGWLAPSGRSVCGPARGRWASAPPASRS